MPVLVRRPQANERIPESSEPESRFPALAALLTAKVFVAAALVTFFTMAH